MPRSFDPLHYDLASAMYELPLTHAPRVIRHNGWLGLLLSVSLTTVFTQVIKITVGRPRPDLIDRCQPVEGAANRAVYGARLPLAHVGASRSRRV